MHVRNLTVLKPKAAMNRHDAKRSHGRSTSIADDGGPGEAAAFVSEMIADLALLARRHGHQTLGFLLDMAQMEADDLARRHQNPQDF